MADANSLVILTFDGISTAAAVYDKIVLMEKEALVEIADAVIIEREAGVGPGNVTAVGGSAGQSGGAIPVSDAPNDEIRVIQTHKKTGKYAAGGAGIGLLVGTLLGGPIGGLIVGAGLGAVTANMKDFGIDNNSIDAIKGRLQPNTSALLVLGHANDRDAFVEKLRSFDPKVLSTTLSPDVEKELRARLDE